MTLPLPTQASGYTWQVASDRECAVTARRPDGSISLSMRLAARELALGEWRVSATTNFGPDAPAELFAAALAWAEGSAAPLVPPAASATLSVDLDAPVHEALQAALASVGLSLAVAEDEYRHALTDIHDVPLPAGFQPLSWNEHAAPLFFHAYHGAFRDRPGFPGWDEARWTAAMTGSAEFRPDLSRVVLDGEEPAAFAILWVEDQAGWIIQVGVRPRWRGQCLGEALLSHALNAFAGEGLSAAALEVATNNPHARALYERTGFRRVAGYESWRKPLRNG